MRSFVAVPLPDAAREALTRAGATIRAGSREWAGERWVAPQNLHITLAFLGDVPESDLAELDGPLSRACAGIEPFSLVLDSVIAVPGPRRASMLWSVPARPSEVCAALAGSVRDAVLPFSERSDARPFTAHVTLVRARRPLECPATALSGAERILAGDATSMLVSVRDVILCSSTLTPRGPIYETISRTCLGVA
ncbi:MAG: RNA 2',3'-cyclic phosphodiesterase [Coriobacteriia bacterium]